MCFYGILGSGRGGRGHILLQAIFLLGNALLVYAKRPQLLGQIAQHVLRAKYGTRALTHKILTSQAMGIKRRPRHCIDLAVLLQRQPRRYEAARPLGGLHHQHTQRKPADNAVADGKIARMRYSAGRKF